MGEFEIDENDEGLIFKQDTLHGRLVQEDEWYLAELRDMDDNDSEVGAIRIRAVSSGVEWQFKDPSDGWSSDTTLATRPTICGIWEDDPGPGTMEITASGSAFVLTQDTLRGELTRDQQWYVGELTDLDDGEVVGSIRVRTVP